MPTILNGNTKLGFKDHIRTIMLKESGGGFTFIELMIVIAILGTIAGIAIPQYASYIETARVTRAIVEIRMLEKEIWLYNDDHNTLPETLNDIGREDLKDPWGNLYRYLNLVSPGKKKPRKDRFLVPINSDYDLYSSGKDGISIAPLTAEPSHDDVIRCNDGEFVGLAYKF